MVIRILTLACFLVLCLEMLVVVINLFLKKRAERIAFIRGFKNGKFAMIYLTAVPLYWIGHVYAGERVLDAFFSSVGKIIKLVVLEYETESIEALLEADPFYHFTVYFTYFLVGINALLFTVSLANQRIWNAFTALFAMLSCRDKLYLFGKGEENITIYKSDRCHSKVIVGDITEEESEGLYLNRIAYISTKDTAPLLEKIFRKVKQKKRKFVLVVNTGSDEENMALSRKIIDGINEARGHEANEELFSCLRVYVFGDPRYETIYADIVASGSGCVHYINKYRNIAVDFIDRYPFALFMDERHIDYTTSLVRRETDINVFMIGFGKTNQQIFLTSVANNQFLTEGENGPELKQVRYHIFDRDPAENNKNLNHSYYRYKHECGELDPDAYLPLPALPAEELYYHLDINDNAFYDRIRKIALQSPDNMNFAVIAFGSDLENIDMAQKLVEKRKEWGLPNLVLFVKVRAWHEEQTVLEEQRCFFIGNERDVIYNIDKIMHDKLFRMAQMRNETYDIESTMTYEPGTVIDAEFLSRLHSDSYRDWYTVKSETERESSLYACLSLRSKLNLMGLDYCEREANDLPALTEEEFLAIYAKGDPLVPSPLGATVTGKPIITYTIEFPPSMRRNLAIHEHQRWNSFMISRGMIPSSIDEIKHEKRPNGKPSNGKNYAVRRHGNLTTFDGLVQFRRIVAEREGKPEKNYDVIKYDYQLLDDAYWFITACGCKIVRKPRRN